MSHGHPSNTWVVTISAAHPSTLLARRWDNLPNVPLKHILTPYYPGWKLPDLTYGGTVTLMLRTILPSGWTGICVAVQLVMPFVLAPMALNRNWHSLKLPSQHSHRQKHDAVPQGTFDKTIWIGTFLMVPDEKALIEILLNSKISILGRHYRHNQSLFLCQNFSKMFNVLQKTKVN